MRFQKEIIHTIQYQDKVSLFYSEGSEEKSVLSVPVHRSIVTLGWDAT